jgi:hypothetical protein
LVQNKKDSIAKKFASDPTIKAIFDEMNIPPEQTLQVRESLNRNLSSVLKSVQDVVGDENLDLILSQVDDESIIQIAFNAWRGIGEQMDPGLEPDEKEELLDLFEKTLEDDLRNRLGLSTRTKEEAVQEKEGTVFGAAISEGRELLDEATGVAKNVLSDSGISSQFNAVGDFTDIWNIYSQVWDVLITGDKKAEDTDIPERLKNLLKKKAGGLQTVSKITTGPIPSPTSVLGAVQSGLDVLKSGTNTGPQPFIQR